MNKFSRSVMFVVVAMIAALTVGLSSPSASGQTSDGVAVTSERFVETSNGSVWTIFTFETAIYGATGTDAAIEGGLTAEGLRLEVSGWPSVSVGERYEVRIGPGAHPELGVPALLEAEAFGDQGGGYTPGPAQWEDGADLRWQGNVGSFPSGSGLSDQGITTAIDNGIDAWTNEAGPVTISSSYGGTTSVATNVFDGVNAVYWADTTAAENYLARTYLWFTDPDANPATPGVALEFDIKFNNDYQWAIAAASGRFDIESVSLHEAGHAIGLGHVDSNENSMYPSLVVGSIKRALGQGDITGMQALYGDGTAVVTTPTAFCRGQKATIVGTNSADVLNGTSGNDVIVGAGGSDRIDGRGGNDIICGGDGNDVINAGGGSDRVYAGAGDDTVTGGGGRDTLVGEAGKDTLRGGAKRDVLKGGGGNDQLFGDAGRDRLLGQGGADILNGGRHADNLVGGGGRDVISTTNGDTGNAGKGIDKCTQAGTISSCEKKI